MPRLPDPRFAPDCAILVDGQIIATQTLTNNSPGQFFDVVYPVPQDRTAGKTNVTVKFQAHAGMTAGGVFGLRMLTSFDPGPLLSITLKVTTDQPGGPQIAHVFANFQNLTNHPVVNSSWLVLQSSDPQVFTVANSGVIQPISGGTATVTVVGNGGNTSGQENYGVVVSGAVIAGSWDKKTNPMKFKIRSSIFKALAVKGCAPIELISINRQ